MVVSLEREAGIMPAVYGFVVKSRLRRKTTALAEIL